jgi:hypothetical protein
LALAKNASKWLPLAQHYRGKMVRGEIPYAPELFESAQEYQRLRAEYQAERMSLSNPNVVENPETGEKLKWDGTKWVDYWTGIPYSAQ